VFPSQVTVAYKQAFDALSQAANLIASASCNLSAEGKSAYIQTKIDALPILANGDSKGLRIDICIKNLQTEKEI